MQGFELLGKYKTWEIKGDISHKYADYNVGGISALPPKSEVSK